MLKLVDILRDVIIESDIIKLPESEIRNVTNDVLVPFIRNELIPAMTEDMNIPSSNPYMPEEMTNIYTIPGYNEQEYKISGGFYYSITDGASAKMDINNNRILINMAKANIYDLETIIIHEMTHAIDQKLRKDDVNRKIYQKYYGQRVGDKFQFIQNEKMKQQKNEQLFARYFKDPREFDAHTGEIIRTLKNNFDLLPDGDVDEYRKDLWKVIIDARNNTGQELWGKYNQEPLMYLFTDNWFNKIESVNIIQTNFYRWLDIFSVWATKPTLYKRFYNRLTKYVPYTS
jgi:hypothetical protein